MCVPVWMHVAVLVDSAIVRMPAGEQLQRSCDGVSVPKRRWSDAGSQKEECRQASKN